MAVRRCAAAGVVRRSVGLIPQEAGEAVLWSQDNAWHQLFPSGIERIGRVRAAAVWSDDFQGFFIFGGKNSNGTGPKPRH